MEYISEKDYNNGDFSDSKLTDHPDFTDGNPCFMVIDFSCY